MKDLSDLKHRIHGKDVRFSYTEKWGFSLSRAILSRRSLYQNSKYQTANDRYCEILEALKEFPLTPKVLNKFEWEGSSILVMSAIEVEKVDQVLKKLYAVQKKFLCLGMQDELWANFIVQFHKRAY
jgi:hypothetical protein